MNEKFAEYCSKFCDICDKVKNIEVGIIMPVYNTAYDLLHDSFASVMNQVYDKPIKFIMIDDWSTDLEDGRIEFYTNLMDEWYQKRPNDPFYVFIRPQSSEDDSIKHNHGLSFVLNWGKDMIDTEYVMFIDSDDMIKPDTIDLLMRPFKECSDVDLSIGDWTNNILRFNVDCTEGQQIPTKYISSSMALMQLPYIMANTDLHMLSKSNLKFINTHTSDTFSAAWNKIYRREIINEIKFPEGKNRGDNFVAHHVLSQCRKIAYTPAITYYYRPGGSLAGPRIFEDTDIFEAHWDRVLFLDSAVKKASEDRMDTIYDDNGHMIYAFVNSCLTCLFVGCQVLLHCEDPEIKRKVSSDCRKLLRIERIPLVIANGPFIQTVINILNGETNIE